MQSTSWIPRDEWDGQLYEAIEAYGITRSDAQAVADAVWGQADDLYHACTWPKDAAEAIMGEPAPAPSPVEQFEANVEAGIPAAVVIRPEVRPVLILNSHQAEAVYSAMCHLNNVCGRLDAFLGDDVSVKHHASGKIAVYHAVCREVYADQAAFAAAYGPGA